jgi:hypothetical protein
MLVFFAPFAASSSLLASLSLVWVFIVLLGLSVFLLLRLELKRYVRSILIAAGFSIPWSAILFIPLPDNSQFLLAAFVALSEVLLYRYYQARKSKMQRKTML